VKSNKESDRRLVPYRVTLDGADRVLTFDYAHSTPCGILQTWTVMRLIFDCQ